MTPDLTDDTTTSFFDTPRVRAIAFLSLHASGAGLYLQLPLLTTIGLAATAAALVALPSRPGTKRRRSLHAEDLPRSSRAEIITAIDTYQYRAQQDDPAASHLQAGLPSKNAAYNAMVAEIQLVAELGLDPILLLGPTGSGKTELARRIHAQRVAAGLISGPFYAVNCAHLRHDLHLTLLVGHTSGAFTGARNLREGLLALATDGTIFFDEVGELSPEQQIALLSILDEKVYRRFGSDEVLTTNATFIFGTLRDLDAMVEAGTFRDDLLNRIDVCTYELPPITDRPEDLDGLATFALEVVAKKRLVPLTWAAGARAAWDAFAPTGLWPDNIRGIFKSMTRLSFTRDGVITLAAVQREMARLTERWSRRGRTRAVPHAPAAAVATVAAVTDPAEAELPPALRGTLSLLDRATLITTIRACRAAATLVEAAEILYDRDLVSSRKTKADRLRKELRNHGLTFDAIKRGW